MIPTHNEKRHAGKAGRGKSKKDAVKPGKNTKPTRQAIAAELKRARAALDGGL